MGGRWGSWGDEGSWDVAAVPGPVSEMQGWHRCFLSLSLSPPAPPPAGHAGRTRQSWWARRTTRTSRVSQCWRWRDTWRGARCGGCVAATSPPSSSTRTPSEPPSWTRSGDCETRAGRGWDGGGVPPAGDADGWMSVRGARAASAALSNDALCAWHVASWTPLDTTHRKQNCGTVSRGRRRRRTSPDCRMSIPGRLEPFCCDPVRHGRRTCMPLSKDMPIPP